MEMNAIRPAASGIISPLSFVKAVWNHKYVCLPLWLLLTTMVAFVVHRLPAVYRAEAAVLVESQRIPERYVSATVTPDLQDRLSALSAQILSASRLTSLIDKYGLYRQERRRLVREEVLDMMRADISIKPDRAAAGRSTAFRISYQGRDPVVVAQVANQIGSFFVDENLRQRETEAEGTSEFLESQLSEAKKRLEEQETMLSRYKLSHNGELPQQENALLSSVGQVKVQLMGVQDALGRARQNKITLEASLASAQTSASSLLGMSSNSPLSRETEGSAEPLATLPSPSTPQEDSQRIAAQLAALTIRYSQEHPEVRRLKAELQRALDAEKRAEVSSAEPPAPATLGAKLPAQAPKAVRQMSPELAQSFTAIRERIENLKVQISAANREIDDLNAERQNIVRNLNSLEARLENLPVREQQLAAVTRDYETTKAAYQSLLDKKLAADVAADMEKRHKAERFVMLEVARVPEKPIKPKRQLLVGGGCLGSLFLSMTLVIGWEFRKGVLLGEWELPGSVTVLGRIPVLVSRPVTDPGVRHPWVVAFTGILLALTAAAAGVYFGWVKL